MKRMAVHLSLIVSLTLAVSACAGTYNLTDPKEFFLHLVSLAEANKNVLRDDSKLELRFQAKGTVSYPTKQAAAEAASQQAGGADMYTVMSYRERSGQNSEPGEQSTWVVLEKRAIVTSFDIRDASAVASAGGTNPYTISFTLTPEAGQRFGQATGARVGDRLALVLNDEVRSIAIINQRIEDKGQIAGNFTQREAEDLAAMLNSAKLADNIAQWAEQLSERIRAAGPEQVIEHYNKWAKQLHAYSSLNPAEIEATLEPSEGDRKILHIKLLKPGADKKELSIRVTMDGGRLRIDE